MDSLLFSFNAIFPLLLCSITGILLRRFGLIGTSFIKDCSNVVFFIAIPCNIFCSIAGENIFSLFDIKLIFFLLFTCLTIASVSVVLCNKLIPDKKTAATVAHNIFRSNFTLLGIPLAINLLGKSQAAPMMLLVPFGMLFVNICSAVMLSTISSQPGITVLQNSLRSTGHILLNPMTIASILGITISLAAISLPTIITTTIDYFSNMSGGLALLMMGAQLEFADMRKNWKYTVATVFFRLFFIPTVVSIAAITVGFRGGTLVALFIFFAAPTAVSSYVLATNMGGDGKLAGDAVLATSCVSSITLTIGIFVLKSLQLF